MERCLPFVALLTTLSLVNLWSTPTNAHQSIVVQPKSSAAMQHPTVRPTTSATTHRCAPGLPKGCWCSKVDGVTSITCSAIRLTAVPKNWIDAGNSVVKTLNLEHNNISEVNIGDFFGVKIERLLLSNNSLRELNFLSFWGLEYSLQTLDLSYNHFRRVPFEALRLLRNLRLLTLTGNEITSLRDFDFGYMRKLEILSLDKNPITTIDRHAFVGTQLLLLAFNWIHLGDSLADLPTDDLRYINGLSLSHNKVKTIPVGWFRNLKSLRHLSLDDNLLTSLDPETFEGVENSLVSLQLNNNRFTEVPTEALQRLGNLQTLELSHNRIRRVHRRAFNSSSSLQALDLSYNRINKISKRAFVGLDSIHKIDLRHNRLITLDDITFNGLRNGGKGRLEVYISENPWLCNCIVKWIKEELDRNSGLIEEMDTQQTHKLFADEPTCDRPAYYKGHAISSVPLEDFNCDHQYYYYYYDNDNDGDGEQAQVETDADNDTNSASYGDTGLDSKSAYEDDNDKVQSSNDDDENEDDEEEEDNEEEEEEEEENEDEEFA